MLDDRRARHETGERCCSRSTGSATDLPLDLDLRGLTDRHGDLEVAEHHLICDDDPYAASTRDAPDRVRPRRGTDAQVRDRRLTVELPAASWSALRLQPVTATREPR